MGREGPCFHCGIKYTPLWRSGPPEKPVLCNACGSRWRIRGTLNNYIPKHANKNNQSHQLGKLPLKLKPAIPVTVHNCRKPKLGAKVERLDNCSTCLEDDTNIGSSSGSTISLSQNSIQTESINDSVQPTILNPKIPRRKRSVLNQLIMSPIERLNWQLYKILHEPEFSKLSTDQEDVLIFHNSNQMSSTTETGLGAVLLKLPNTSTEDFEPDPLTEENKAPCLTYIP